jgi:hypothetical protein
VNRQNSENKVFFYGFFFNGAYPQASKSQVGANPSVKFALTYLSGGTTSLQLGHVEEVPSIALCPELGSILVFFHPIRPP